MSQSDDINHPDHYTIGGIETYDFIKAKLTEIELIGYLKGNIIKYLSRAPYKNKELSDIRKADWYMKKLVEEYGNGTT